jgi:hypothetical protein
LTKCRKWLAQNAANFMTILTGFPFPIAPLAGIVCTQTALLKTAKKYAVCADVK